MYEAERSHAKDARASVAFSRDELDRVRDAARREGATVSEFIRQSAIRRAAGQGRATAVLRVSGGSGLRGINEDTTSVQRTTRMKINRAAETY